MAALHAASLAVPATEATRVATLSPAAAAPEEERPALPVPAARTDAAGERTATARKEGEKENVATSFWERSRTFELRPNATQAAQAAQLAAEMWAAHSCAGAAVAKGLVAETIDRADDIVRVTRTSAARHSEPR